MFTVTPAHYLNSKPYLDPILKDYIEDILDNIDNERNDAFELRKRKCRVELPVAFDVPGLSLAKAQQHVYYHVIQALEKASYIVDLEFIELRNNKQKVFINVSWTSPEVAKQEKEMDTFLKKRTKRYRAI